MPPEVDRLFLVWSRTLKPPTLRLIHASLLTAVVGAARLARVGTGSWRLVAGILLIAWILVVVVTIWNYRRRSKNLRWVLRRVIGDANPKQGERADRALSLLERARKDPSEGSLELANLHLARQIERVSVDAVRSAAEQRAGRMQKIALVLAASGLLLVGLEPLRIVEGLDVLSARGGNAPIDLSYVHALRVEVQPPEYLRQTPQSYIDESKIRAPYGSVVTFRGAPMHSGRRLVLTDGSREIPFLDDGSGKVLARWPLKESVTLDVAARFGDVRIGQGEPVHLESIADAAPEVIVDGAPRTMKILEVTEIPVLYHATDDHGLREIALVLRAGPREERRVLARLDGETKRDEGGYQLRNTDSFLRNAYLPVEVTVEARDNDPLTGPKWGKSSPLILLPPAIGEPEALRYEALLATRGGFIDLLAAVMEAPERSSSAELAKLHEQWLEPVQKSFQEATGGTFGGLRLPGRTVMFAEGQLRKIVDALKAERRAPGARTHQESIKVIESTVLAMDRITLALAGRDARSVSKRLSRVALDAADQLHRVRLGTQRVEDGLAHVDAAILILDPSGKALSRLGSLGADLGSIVANDLRRLHRALKAKDLYHAELVAYDLGLRLQRANPSFAGGAGGVGEGDGHGKGSPADEAASGEGEGAESGEEDAFQAEQQALQELLRDHAGNMESTQQAMKKAGEDALSGDLLEEAKRHAQQVRQAVQGLPRQGEGEESSGAARELAEQTAQSLEHGDIRGALEAARAAEKSLEEGARVARQQEDPVARMIAKNLEEARQGLSPERRWMEDALQKMQQAMRQKADLKDASERELRLAERTRDLGKQAQGERGSLPQQALERLQQAEQAMRDASKAMDQGNGEEALEHQRKAQHLLDGAGAPEDERSQEPPPNQREDGTGRSSATGPAAIPGADEHQGPQEFRKRVSEGLKQGQTPSLREAIKRYAERLLR